MNPYLELTGVSGPLERLIRDALATHFQGAGEARIRLTCNGEELRIEEALRYPPTAHTGPSQPEYQPEDCRGIVRRALRIAGLSLTSEA